MCGDQHLPRAGGIEDQDYRQLLLMRASVNIYNVMDHMRNLQGSQIHTLSGSERRLIKWLMESGYYYG